MKHIATILLFIASMFSNQLKAQDANTGKITGKTIAGKDPVAAATVTLLNPDSTEVANTASDQDGKFTVKNIKTGNYLVAISSVGYRRFVSAPVSISASKPTHDLGTVSLKEGSNDLSSVTVVAKKPLIEQKIDRMVVNVDAAVSNAGATALEVLEKSPGITVDKDGNISLKGKQGVQIFIDGRPSYLNGAELVNLLKNMNANQLEQLEIMTNPPAKYDAAGNSGIINIKTKKNKVKGFNGSINAGYSQGKYWRTNESLNLNYRNGKFNAFMNYSYNKNNGFTELSINRIYRNDNKEITAVFDQVANMRWMNDNHNLKAGVDYFVNQKTTIGFVASGFFNPEEQS
ncbi:MAG: TonB-dependent receptor, partial [Flavitalea sp.]